MHPAATDNVPTTAERATAEPTMVRPTTTQHTVAQPMMAETTAVQPTVAETSVTPVPYSRLRFIEPILVSPRPFREPSPGVGYSPAPTSPTAVDSQTAQDPIDVQGVYIKLITRLYPPADLFI
jgi:hypothetical protein